MHVITQHLTPECWVNLKHFIIGGLQVHCLLQTFLLTLRLGDSEQTSHLIKFISHCKLGEIINPIQ